MQLENDQCEVIIALGSNLSTRGLDGTVLLREVEKRITQKIGKINKLSNYYRTPAFPAGSGPDFVNSAISIQYSGDPMVLLAELHEIEATFDRNRDRRWGARTLDLDILFFGNRIAPNRAVWKEWANLDVASAQKLTPSELILPHPRMHERAFVLGPAVEITPEFRHPILDLTIQELWHNLSASDREAIEIIE